MKKNFLLLVVLILLSTILMLQSQPKSLYKARVIVDLGSDYIDPLFTDYSLKDFIKERLSQRLPEFGYTEFEDATVLIKLTLLSENGSIVNNQFVSALNLLITSPFHNPLNWNVLLIDSKDDSMRAKIRDYIDRWILEYSVYIYKSTK
jgi:hypothetical protein